MQSIAPNATDEIRMTTSFVLFLLLLRANLIEKNDTKTHTREAKRASETPNSSVGKSKEPSSFENKQ